MAQIEIGFTAVVQDVHLAMLVWAHGARIDVDVRVEFLQTYPQAPMFQEHADTGTRQAIAQRAAYPTCYENMFRHSLTSRD
ncbi:hypothetical protein HRbin36_01574 [bacterium HR36]|nr:hypothetical protein HRbin36_01574 [bacterium HR36]